MRLLLVAAALAALSIVGCAKEEHAPGGTGDAAGAPKSIKLTMVAKSSTNPFFLSCRTGAEEAAKALSEQHEIPIVLDWRTPPKEDGQIQAQEIAKGVNEGAQGVLVAVSDAAKVKGAIDEAVSRGVHVVTFDSDVPESKRLTFIGCDNTEMGRQVMQELADLTKGKANVAILAGNQNAPNLKLRVDGVKEIAAKYPGIKIVGTFYNEESPQGGTAEVIRVMNAYPEVDAWAMIGGWPLFAPALLETLDPAKVRVVSADALPEQLEYVERGVAPVLVAQRSYDYGYRSVEVLVEKILNGVDPEPVINPELTKVTKANLREWAAQLKEWGFTNVNEKFLR
ncbi:MAG TPA: substrate-binding domain-containing protein [Fimbriimonadaceae bacterium]|nr:substrate-binding domain-containing protein [Fimbriimonadaceae bacterium]